MRYFHQSPDYWLDHGTLQDWRDIYSRELRETPPPEAFLAGYFEYEPPGEAAASDAAEIVEEALPEFEE